MKLSELRPCDFCHGPLRGGIFYVIDVSMAIVNARSANHVLAMAGPGFGLGLGIAEAMAPRADCITIAKDKEPSLGTRLFACGDCYTMNPLDLAVAAEQQNREQESDGELPPPEPPEAA